MSTEPQVVFWHKFPRKITLEVVPHDTQRYPTVGDWFYDPKDSTHLHIKASDTQIEQDWLLVAFHELAEAILCIDRNITEKEVDEFDMNWEKEKAAGKTWLNIEPGLELDAPYHNEHMFAMKVENMLAEELNVDWDAYNDRLDELP